MTYCILLKTGRSSLISLSLESEDRALILTSIRGIKKKKTGIF